jgi:multimeric flavodoxin WrbA
MKIISYIASPRKEVNTAWVVNKILEAAKEKGADTQSRYCSELNINPCKGCLSCVKSDKCVLNDDMQKLYTELKQADALILGSPVYMGQMTAQAKTFTDRLFAHITPRFSPHYKEGNAGKKLILVFTQGNPDASKFQIYYDYTKTMFQLLEFDVKDVVIVTGMRTGSAHEQKGLHSSLIDVGKSLVAG